MKELTKLEVTQPDSTQIRMTISTVEALAEGYEMPEPVPEPETCKFCGRKLLYMGVCNPLVAKRVTVWTKKPERCTCQQAKTFWQHWDAKEAARKERGVREAAKQEEMRRFEALIKRSGMKGRFQQRRFDNFVQDTRGRRQAWKQAKRYADNFQRMLPTRNERRKVIPPEVERNGLFIAGSYGTGKTHLAAAIANQLLEGSTAVICMTMIDLLDRIRETYNATGSEDEAVILRKYQDVPLLIIDDIGSEQPTEWGISKIFAIINARYEAYMPTVVTTNYSGSELIKRMTPANGDERNAAKTIDRLKETCVGIDMTWQSWRIR